jgi:hypothetical protein
VLREESRRNEGLVGVQLNGPGVISARCNVIQSESGLRYEVQADVPGQPRIDLFFEVAGEKVPPPVSRLDFVALALVFLAMRKGLPLHIEGSVSRRLLVNLIEFQRAWSLWAPQLYRPVEVTCTAISDEVPSSRRSAVGAFSGGVDATFAMLYHTDKVATLDRLQVNVAVLVQGFDIALTQSEAFEVAQSNARAMTRLMGVPLSIVRTNFASVGSQWTHAFGAALAACLHLFAELCDTAVMGTDEDYAHFVLPWGSNPVTNHFLSSAGMILVSEGGGFTRTEKVGLIARNQEAAEHLRVCWQGPRTGRNCGACEKCVRTKLNFLAAGAEVPKCLGPTPSFSQILGLRVQNRTQLSYLTDILEQSRKIRMEPSLATAVRLTIWLNFTRLALAWVGRRLVAQLRRLAEPRSSESRKLRA